MGLPKRDVYRRKTDSEPTLSWRPNDRRNEWALREIYALALSKYRQRIKQVHPDAGGSEQECILINKVWERIKYLLKRRGYQQQRDER